jgi:hypothetical protein
MMKMRLVAAGCAASMKSRRCTSAEILIERSETIDIVSANVESPIFFGISTLASK